MIELPIDGGFYESESLPVSAQRLINWYVSVPQTGGALSQAQLFGTDGITEFATTGTNQQANRGGIVFNDAAYFLNGDGLYKFSPDGAYTLIGTLPGPSGRAFFAENGVQMMVLVDGRGWIVDTSDTFTEITDPGFTANGTPKSLTFLDSYFIVTTDEKKFIRSDPRNGLSWGALNFFSAEADPDAIVTCVTWANQLHIIGTQTTEAYQNNAGIFRRQQGYVIDKGAVSPFTIKTGQAVYFYGAGENETPGIYALSNGAQKISTRPIDKILGETDLTEAWAWSYSRSGHRFVGFVITDRCFVYDESVGKWHERESLIDDPRGFTFTDRWRVNSIIQAYGKILVGDSQDGRIGELSNNVYTEYGDDVLRTWIGPPLENQGEAFRIMKLEATVESGNTGIIRLSTSRDGGKTYGNEMQRSMGDLGEYNQKVIWRRLGRYSRFATLKLEMSDPVNPVVIKLQADVR
jgi:hypothetical protein